MAEQVELIHACAAPAGLIARGKVANCINAGFFAEVPGMPSPIFDNNKDKPCLTCPRAVIAAAQNGDRGLLAAEEEIPQGCYFESKLNESLGGANE